MNLVEKEARVTIHHLGEDHSLPVLERGCDGCQYQSQKTLMSDMKPVLRNREVDHLEEEFRLTTWCRLFEKPVEGGPCAECKAKRSRR
jgi:hypothetical protein